MLTRTSPPAGTGHGIAGLSIRSPAGILAAVVVFHLTLAGGLAFISFVVDSHAYHAVIEEAFFGRRHESDASAAASGGNWRMTLHASDLRKIGRIVDTFEMSFLEDLTDRTRAIDGIDKEHARQRAVAGFVARIRENRADIQHMTDELRGLRGSGLEGAPAEFAKIDVSLARLRQELDVLSVAATELDAVPDRVTLHVVQKQLEDTIEALRTGRPAAWGR